MKRNDKTFKEMVSRIQSGELTRSQAADAYDIKVNTLNVWLKRNGMSGSVPKESGYVRPPGVVPNKPRGSAAVWASPEGVDYAALDAAAMDVVTGVYKSCYAAQKANPSLKLSTLTLRVRQLRGMAPAVDLPVPAPEVQADYAKLLRVLGCMGVSIQDATLVSDIASDPARLAKAAAVIRAAGI